ncbi:MAG: Pyridoxamine 5'-phosphate oxidase, partial [uncultured Thermomicrobiales bacterium]
GGDDRQGGAVRRRGSEKARRGDQGDQDRHADDCRGRRHAPQPPDGGAGGRLRRRPVVLHAGTYAEDRGGVARPARQRQLRQGERPALGLGLGAGVGRARRPAKDGGTVEAVPQDLVPERARRSRARPAAGEGHPGGDLGPEVRAGREPRRLREGRHHRAAVAQRREREDHAV